MARVRLIGFYFVALFMFLGPLYKQVLGGKLREIRPWVMFHGFAGDVCAVRYESWHADGRRERIDVDTLLGRSGHWLIESPEEAARLGRVICTKLGGAADVRVWTRCAQINGDGWKRKLKAQENLCVAPAAGSKP